MCGIIGGFHSEAKKWGPANAWAVKQYEDQNRRGTNGFGIVGWNPTGKIEVARATEGAKFMFDIHRKGYQMMMVHHRTPTSTPNLMDQTHPILVKNGSLQHDYLVIHNGMVGNDDELYKKHTEELGFAYTTYLLDKKANTYRFNDSECVAIEVARFVEGQGTEIGAEGSCAFLGVQIDRKTGKPLQVFFGRNEGNPLKFGASRGKIHVSSEGEGEDVEPFQLWSFEPKGDMKLRKRKMAWKEKKPYQGYTTFGKKETPAPAATVTPPCRSISEDESLWDRWEFEEKRDRRIQTTYGGGYDDRLQNDMPPDDVFEAYPDWRNQAMEDLEEEISVYLDSLEDPETAEVVTPDDTMVAVRKILAKAKEFAVRNAEKVLKEAAEQEKKEVAV